MDTDLTPSMRNPHNPEALSEATGPEIFAESRLPEGWVPEGTGVWVVARLRSGDTQWEALVPEFAIAGMGASSQDAIANAFQLLDDYLVLCAEEGKSFADAYRPVGTKWKLDILVEAIAAALTKKRRRPRKPEHSFLRLPIAPVH